MAAVVAPGEGALADALLVSSVPTKGGVPVGAAAWAVSSGGPAAAARATRSTRTGGRGSRGRRGGVPGPGRGEKVGVLVLGPVRPGGGAGAGHDVVKAAPGAALEYGEAAVSAALG